MPLLKVETNTEISPAARTNLLQKASAAVAEMLGKPERYVMISIHHNPGMSFSGVSEPLAYLELKSIGLPENRTKEFSAKLCSLIHEQLQISPERIYIEFSDAQRHLWGWNGGTF